MLGTGQFQLVRTKDLTLDVDNPRIRKWLEHSTEPPNAAQIKLALGVATGDEESENGTTFESLRQSIRASGGINQPIIVNDTGDRKIVIEGNTRLVIYQEFQESETPGNWEKIPAIVYKDMNLEFIEATRLQSHLVGPRAWDPYSKAKYLNHLYTKKHLSEDRIHAYCGGKKRDIANYIDAYRDMETHYRPLLDSDQDFDTTRFSGFVELQKPQVKEAILNAGKTLDDFAQWVHNKKLFPLSTVRQLPKILGNTKSRELFYKKNAREALKALDSPNIDKLISDLTLADLARALQRAIDNLQWQSYREMANNPNDPARQAILDLQETYEQLVAQLENE